MATFGRLASAFGGRGASDARPWVAIALLALVPYLPALGHPLMADDYLHIERLAASDGLLQDLRGWVLRAEDSGAWWTPPDLAVPYFRPLVTLSFFADSFLWGLLGGAGWGSGRIGAAAGRHLTNLLLHVGTSLFVLAIARALFGALGAPTARGRETSLVGEPADPSLAAWAAAALFAVHPCHAEAVLWISGRTDLLASFLYTAAFAVHLRALHSGRWVLGVGSAVLFAAALFAKEMAITYPAVVALHAILSVRGKAGDERPRYRRLGPALVASVVAATYLGVRSAVLGRAGLPPHPFAHGPGDPYADMVWNAVSSAGMYLLDLVFGVPAEPVLGQPFWRAYPVGLVVAVAGAAVVVWWFVKDLPSTPLRRFGLVATAVTLIPVLPISPGERFLYLPSVPFCLLIGAEGARLWRSAAPRARGWVAAASGVIAFGLVLRVVGYGVLSDASRAPIDDALAAIDAAPRADLVLVVDLPAASSLGFANALRLGRPDRELRVEVLSLASELGISGPPPLSRLEARGPDRFVVTAGAEPFFGSYVERAYLGERAPFVPGEVVERPDVMVTAVDVREERLYAFEVRVRDASDGEVLLLRSDGARLHAAALPFAGH